MAALLYIGHGYRCVSLYIYIYMCVCVCVCVCVYSVCVCVCVCVSMELSHQWPNDPRAPYFRYEAPIPLNLKAFLGEREREGGTRVCRCEDRFPRISRALPEHVGFGSSGARWRCTGHGEGGREKTARSPFLRPASSAAAASLLAMHGTRGGAGGEPEGERAMGEQEK